MFHNLFWSLVGFETTLPVMIRFCQMIILIITKYRSIISEVEWSKFIVNKSELDVSLFLIPFSLTDAPELLNNC